VVAPFFYAEPQTEPVVAMLVAMAKKVEQDQRVAGMVGRTGENRTRRPNGTELEFERSPCSGN
jgi:hypothetical protein